LQEAVCEIRFKAAKQWDATAPGLVYSQLKETLPKRRAATKFNVGAPEKLGSPVLEIESVARFDSEDEKSFLQLAPNYLSVHKLAPYPGWTGFRPLIIQAINAYGEAAEPAGIQRVGFRCVNRIEVNQGTVELKDLFNFYPELEAGLPQNMVRTHTSVLVPYEDGRDGLLLQLYTGDKPGDRGLYLDLDYFLAKVGGVEPGTPLLEWLEQAHLHTRDVFKAALKPSLLERFGYSEVSSA
jgi:uncharacterized protein (TIGR04255 family)